MKKAKLFIVALALLASFGNVSIVYGALVPLQLRPVDPTIIIGTRPRTPIDIPEIDIEGYTLTFIDSCVGCTLQLVNADDEVEYSTVISSDTLVLPSTLEGEYEIRIICGDHYFYGFIEL